MSAPLRELSPLRTVRATFTAYGSSNSKLDSHKIQPAHHVLVSSRTDSVAGNTASLKIIIPFPVKRICFFTYLCVSDNWNIAQVKKTVDFCCILIFITKAENPSARTMAYKVFVYPPSSRFVGMATNCPSTNLHTYQMVQFAEYAFRTDMPVIVSPAS